MSEMTDPTAGERWCRTWTQATGCTCWATPGAGDIRQAAAAVETAKAQLVSAVAVARERGSTWQEIGDVFGISRQAAWERFAPDMAGGAR